MYTETIKCFYQNSFTSIKITHTLYRNNKILIINVSEIPRLNFKDAVVL